MRKKIQPRKRTSKVRRQRDPIPWKYCILTLVCGLFLVSGFFWAARAHFSSMDYGMKNAKLRKEIEQLKSETRRLKLAREIALSPAEIKKAAKKLGLTTMTARNIEVVETKETVVKEPDTTRTFTKEKEEPKAKKELDQKDLTAKLKKSKKPSQNKSLKVSNHVDQETESFRKDGISRNQIARR
jgi:hypothetical protein